MRTENFVDYHPQLKDILYGDRIGSILKQLGGDVSQSAPLYTSTVQYISQQGTSEKTWKSSGVAANRQ